MAWCRVRETPNPAGSIQTPQAEPCGIVFFTEPNWILAFFTVVYSVNASIHAIIGDYSSTIHFQHNWAHFCQISLGAIDSQGAVAESVEHGSRVREIVDSNPWSSQTNDL